MRSPLPSILAWSGAQNSLGAFSNGRFNTVLESCGKVLGVFPIDGVILPNIEMKILHMVFPASPYHR